MARPTKSFSDLQRELITTQMAQRRLAERNAADNAVRVLVDDAAVVRQDIKLSVVKS